jgi:choline dehydrogenase
MTRTRNSARINHYTRVRKGRANYHILAEHVVAKVIFQDNTATGVEYLPSGGGTSLKAFASKEVILAAGALHTPQILQLSGIGPKSHLEKLQIPVLVNLPGVGANFQDQPSLSVPYTGKIQIKSTLHLIMDL